MKQAIAGVSPPGLGEVTVMTVWPSVGGTPLGRALGRLFSIKAGFWHIFTVGKLLALLAMPLGAPLVFMKFAPWDCRRFRLTNRRVIIEKGFNAEAERSLPLEQFDAIDVNILPGQDWYPCGELIFRHGKVETLRLSGVPRPETFRRTCLKAQLSHVGVQRALEAEAGV
jgi:hypothetical protein